MISKRIAGRKDSKSSAEDALSYGEGLTADRETGELADKSHRTRLGNFGLVDDGVYAGRDISEMAELIKLAAFEMQNNCDLNTRVGADKKIAHFVISFNQERPSEAVLRDTEDSMLAAMKLENNHFTTFLHNDNGYWHLHLFTSRIDTTAKHLGSPLWHDKIKRDKVCREVEIRHGLNRDNGLHEINARGEIVEVPKERRIAEREQKQTERNISDGAKQVEKYSGEKTFQTWCSDIRIGDRLKHARSWKELHETATAYGCVVKPKGAGFVICPVGEKGGIQLSKVGLKNLPAKFGVFVPANQSANQEQPEHQYKPEPTQADTKNLYREFSTARDSYKSVRLERRNELREQQKQERAALRAKYKKEISDIRAVTTGDDRFVKVSVAKMQQAAALAALSATHERERAALFSQRNDDGPGHTFREYLEKQANLGSAPALAALEQYAAKNDTSVARDREDDQLKIVARVAGREENEVPPLPIRHRVTWLGSVVYSLDADRRIVDDRLAKLIKLNGAAVGSPEAIETALRFATSKFGLTLTFTGSNQFQAQAVEIAVKKGLGVRFADPVLDAYRARLEAERSAPKPATTQTAKPKERKENAKAISNTRTFDQFDRFAPHPEIAGRRSRVQDVHGSDVATTAVDSALLLPRNAPDHMGYEHADLDTRLRRDGSGRSGIDEAVPPLPSKPEPTATPLPDRSDNAAPGQPVPGQHFGKVSLSQSPGYIIQKVGRDACVSYKWEAFSPEQQAVLTVAANGAPGESWGARSVQIDIDKDGKPSRVSERGRSSRTGRD
jgi:hypothetical protein